MATKSNKLGKDSKRIEKRIAAGKKAIQTTEKKAEELQAAIHTALQLQEHSNPQQKMR
ncbi:MAG TPA: hypothetical protein VGV18_03920 [Verrucomicrobiae bacterium]|nr:hypothetical protein [Verrucomicrobiae bacterium]